MGNRCATGPVPTTKTCQASTARASTTRRPKSPARPRKDGIDKSLKQAFASLWNFRAFTEREFYRVDHMAAAMGVLVHPNYKDELVNGVAVSVDPAYGRNGQLLLEQPDWRGPGHQSRRVLGAGGGPVAQRWQPTPLSHSPTRLRPGQLLMTEAQMGQLAHDTSLRFMQPVRGTLYSVVAGEEFAIEIEYKITSDNVLAIKQARPWIFSVDPVHQHRPPAQARTIP